MGFIFLKKKIFKMKHKDCFLKMELRTCFSLAGELRIYSNLITKKSSYSKYYYNVTNNKLGRHNEMYFWSYLIKNIFQEDFNNANR